MKYWIVTVIASLFSLLFGYVFYYVLSRTSDEMQSQIDSPGDESTSQAPENVNRDDEHLNVQLEDVTPHCSQSEIGTHMPTLGNISGQGSDTTHSRLNQDHLCQSTRLTTDDIKEVLDKVWKARNKWYNIGIQLEVNVNDLDSIKQSCNNYPGECFREMLITWLRQTPDGASWKSLISALSHETVGFHDLAAAMKNNYAEAHDDDYMHNHDEQPAEPSANKKGFQCPLCGACTLEEYLKGKCPKFSSKSDSAFQYLETNNLTKNEIVTLQTTLHTESQTVITKFANLVFEMRRSFTERNIDPKDIATTILSIAPLESSTHPLSGLLNVEEVDSIHTIIGRLLGNNYLSFFNHHIVEFLITKYGTESDRDMLNSYEQSFEEFCKRSVFEVPKDVFGPPPSDGEIIVFKVTNDVLKSFKQQPSNALTEDMLPPSSPTVQTSSRTLNLSLEDAQTVQKNIAKALHLKNVGALVFLSASKGCIQLTFSVPKVIMNGVKPQLNTISGHSSSNTESGDRPSLFANLEESGIHLLCGPPGKPHTMANNSTETGTIHLMWTKPEYHGFHPVQHYLIHYRSISDSLENWKTLQTEGCKEDLKIKELPQTQFVFKVQAVSSIGTSLESELSDPIDLSPSYEESCSKDQNIDIYSKPGKPRASMITTSSIQLEWTKPELGAHNITSYAVLYRSASDPPDQWMKYKTKPTEETVTVLVSQLSENTEYHFKICPEYMGGIAFDLESDISEPIVTKVAKLNRQQQ